MVYIIIGWICSAILCAYIASEKNRGGTGWFFAGLVFGIFAVIAIVAVPVLSKEERRRREQKAIDEEDSDSTEGQIALKAKQDKQPMGQSFFDPVQRAKRERSAHEKSDE